MAVETAVTTQPKNVGSKAWQTAKTMNSALIQFLMNSATRGML
jgi:hypothetical protein